MNKVNFLAFHIEERKLYNVTELSLKKDGSIRSVEVSDTDRLKHFNGNEIYLLQSTTHFDNRDKEVFEGAIIELTWKLYPKKDHRIAVVVWLDNKPSFRAIDAKYYAANFTNSDKFTVKVIGHIFTDKDKIPSAVLKNEAFLKYKKYL